MTKKFVFDWQEHAPQSNSFLGWFLPEVLVGVSPSEQEEISENSKQFTECAVQIIINGVEVDSKNFLEAVEQNLELLALKEAQRMLSEFSGLDKIQNLLSALQNHLIIETRDLMGYHGIELPPRDEWDD